MERLKGNRDEVAWQEFYDIYRPLIYRYARQRGLSGSDAEEIVGECFQDLARAMPEFEYQPARGKFKSWLKKLVNYKISNWRSGPGREGLVPDFEMEMVPDDDCPHDQLWETAWRNEVLNFCVQRARASVSVQNFQIFHLNVFEGWSPQKIAETFEMTSDQVYRAKHKVLQKVRQEMARYLAD